MKKEDFFERANQRTMVMMDIIRNYRRVETQQLVPVAEAGDDAPLPSRIAVEALANKIMILSEEIVDFIDRHYFQKIRRDDEFDEDFYDTLKWCHNNPGEKKLLSIKFRIPESTLSNVTGYNEPNKKYYIVDSGFSEQDISIIEKYPDILTAQIGRIVNLGCNIEIRKIDFKEYLGFNYYEFIFHDVIKAWVD